MREKYVNVEIGKEPLLDTYACIIVQVLRRGEGRGGKAGNYK